MAQMASVWLLLFTWLKWWFEKEKKEEEKISGWSTMGKNGHRRNKYNTKNDKKMCNVQLKSFSEEYETKLERKEFFVLHRLK